MNEYFKRKSSAWNISDFLEECGIGEFMQKIEAYLTSLKVIADIREGKRSERAKELLDNYKKDGQPGPDYKLARDWEKNHNKPAKVGVHFNNSTITAINGNIGNESYITGGTTINEGALSRKSSRKRRSVNESQAEPDKKPKRKSTRSTNNSIDNHEIGDHNEDDNEAEDEREINDFTDFDLAYQSLDPAKMWTLESSGRIVEKIIYGYARTLKHESHLHSLFLVTLIRKHDHYSEKKNGRKYSP